MTVNIQIKQDSKEVERLLSGLGRGADKVITRALNRTLDAVHTAARRSIAKDLGIKQKTVTKSLKKYRASFNRKRAEVQASGRRIPLLAFNARQTKRGVTYKHRGGGRRLLSGVFIATMPSGHTGVFKRTGYKRAMKKGRYKGKVRETITELHGASIPYVMLQRRVNQIMDDAGIERWNREIRRQLTFYLRSRNG